jgi:hypothetical protein
MRFVIAVSSTGGVRELRMTTSRDAIDLWVLMDTENIEVEEQMLLLEDELFTIPGYVDVNVHPLPLDRVGIIPDGDTIFQRA